MVKSENGFTLCLSVGQEAGWLGSNVEQDPSRGLPCCTIDPSSAHILDYALNSFVSVTKQYKYQLIIEVVALIQLQDPRILK
jgi:hypothetical protein